MAVVTAFCPTADLLGNVARLRDQVDGVVVVDDASGEAFDGIFGDLENAGAVLVRLSTNSGIAAALNAGVAAAQLADDDLVVTFDQDSTVPDGFVDALVRGWDAARRSGRRVGSVSPASFAGESQTFEDATTAREPIQSGCLYSGEVIREVGPFRTDFFIDLVDTEYYFRLRSMNFECLAVPGLDLPHELGRSYPIAVFGHEIVWRGHVLTTSLSTPFRYFYRARNRVVVNAEYRDAERALLRRDRLLELRHLAFVLMYARPRVSMMRLLSLGRRAGRRGAMGRIPDDALEVAMSITWSRVPVSRERDGSRG